MFLYLLLFLNIICAVSQISAVGESENGKDQLKPIAIQTYTHRIFNNRKKDYRFQPYLFKKDHGEKKDQPVVKEIEEPTPEVVPAVPAVTPILEVPAIQVKKEIIKPQTQTLKKDVGVEKMTLRPSNKKQEPHVEKMTLRSDGKPSIVKYLSIKKNKTKKNSKKKCPYSDCGKKYGQQYFNEHMRSHQGEFKCLYCKDDFASAIVLKRHKRICCCR